MLKVVIIEDEKKSRDVLRNLIYRFCTDVQIVGEAPTVKLGVDIINSKHPDLVFLDIELPEQNGFALFDVFKDPSFEVVFTTAYDQFAIQAFRISALDYLLKPINFKHLQEAVKKVKEKNSLVENLSKIEVLNDAIKNEKFDKIALPVSNGFVFVNLKEILFCKAERNYTSFNLVNGKKELISKPLRFFEEVLGELNFFRVNRSIMININFVQGYSRTNSGEVILSNNERFSVSEQRKQRFLQRIKLAQ